MIVSELITLLKTFPEDVLVACEQDTSSTRTPFLVSKVIHDTGHEIDDKGLVIISWIVPGSTDL